MSQVGFLGASKIVNQRACGADRDGMVIEAEALESAGVQLFEQDSARRFAIERP